MGRWVLLLGLLMGVRLAAADKVDVLTLKNGDRVTCEILELDQSVMSISTDAFGKASVHWGEIVAVMSPRTFDIQLASGEHHLGALAPATPGQINLVFAGRPPTTIAMMDIVRLAPIGVSFWSRVNGSVDAGFSFTQADLETHWTLNGSTVYRSPRYLFNGTIASQVTTRDEGDSISRNSLTTRGARSFGNKWYTVVTGQLQQNQELSLDLRVVAGGGIGRDFVHTSRRLWTGYSGLAYTHEQYSATPAEQSAEALFGGSLDFFTPGTEDFKFTNSLVSYVNVSGRSRIRVELQSAYRHEWLKDFYWSFNGFDSFDSDPPDEQKSNDFGVSFTLGWKF